MKLSVIIPVRNEASIIQSSLEALQWLRQLGHELILVDGGSEDDTGTIAQPWVDHLIDSEAGRARQMNAGAKSAAGNVLLFLHSDTVLPQAAVQVLEAAMSGQTDAWGRFDVRLSGYHPAFRLIETLMNMRSRLSGIATGDQAIFISRSLFEQTGGFPDLPLMEDIEMSRRLKHIRSPLCLKTRIITSSRRWETNGIISTIVLMWRLRFLYWIGVDAQTLARQYYPASR